MSAKIITCFNQKGGSAKTLTSMQLGASTGLRGLKTLIVDMDKQGTGYVWASKAPKDKPFPATVLSMAALHEGVIEAIQKVVDDYDIIIIDCPPALESRIPWAALTICDLAIIPIIPTMGDYWAARPAKDLAIRAKEINPEMKLCYVLSNYRRGAVASSIIKLLKNEAAEIEILGKGLSQRNAFSDCQVWGTSVHTLPKAEKAIEEIESLATTVLAKLGVSQPAAEQKVA